MDKHTQYMSIKQAKLIANAHEYACGKANSSGQSSHVRLI